MTKTSHTAGPWKINQQNNYAIIYAGFTEQICVCKNNADDMMGVLSQEEQSANAKLISAAPDLLEALMALTDIVSGLEAECDSAGIGDLVEVRDAWRKADAAIAKAKGRKL